MNIADRWFKSATLVSDKRGEGGQAVMEWVMLLGVIIVPMTLMIFYVMRLMEGFYAFTSWVIALPFP